MCTVTFIPSQDRTLIISSRDEQVDRLPALPPAIYFLPELQTQLLYPKDGNAGGSWIAVSDRRNAVVLLNGAWKKHVHQPPYRKSRGLVLLELAAAASPFLGFDKTDYAGIEPFTAVIFEQDRLYDCRWDGQLKSLVELNATQAHIWSSVTLYDPAATEKRLSWFRTWIGGDPSPSTEHMLDFHRDGGEGDPVNDIRMQREQLRTVSITALEIFPDGARMQYESLPASDAKSVSLPFTTSMPATP